MENNTLVMGEIAHVARELGLKVEARDLHLGAVWCKTTGGKYGCVLTLDGVVSRWGREWAKAIFFNGETGTTKEAFLKANHLGSVFAILVNR